MKKYLRNLYLQTIIQWILLHVLKSDALNRNVMLKSDSHDSWPLNKPFQLLRKPLNLLDENLFLILVYIWCKLDIAQK